jgi:hypothetical protein
MNSIVTISFCDTNTEKSPSITTLHILLRDGKKQTLDQVCQERSYSKWHKYETNIYNKIDYAIKYNLHAFIECYITDPIHCNYVLSRACTVGNLSLVKWITSKRNEYLDLCGALNIAVEYNDYKIANHLYSLIARQGGKRHLSDEVHVFVQDLELLDYSSIEHVEMYLHHARVSGNIKVIQELLPLKPDYDGFLIACAKGYMDLVQYFMKQRTYQDYYIHYGFYAACETNNLDLAKHLYRDNIDLHRAFLTAYVNNSDLILQFLQPLLPCSLEEFLQQVAHYYSNMENGINKMYLSSLGHAIYNLFLSYPQIIQASLSYLDLIKCIRNGSLSLLHCIIEKKIKISLYGWCALLKDACHMETDTFVITVLQYILQHEAELLEQQQRLCITKQGYNQFLQMALAKCYESKKLKNPLFVICLLEKHVSHDTILDSCLEEAAHVGCKIRVKHALSKGANNLNQAFCNACEGGHYGVVKYLYKRLLDKSSEARDALKNASVYNHLHIVTFLLDKHPEHLNVALNMCIHLNFYSFHHYLKCYYNKETV